LSVLRLYKWIAFGQRARVLTAKLKHVGNVVTPVFFDLEDVWFHGVLQGLSEEYSVGGINITLFSNLVSVLD
jgi:hypothetical protein